MSSDELSRETPGRRPPINGGTWICSRCKERRVPGSAYCREHKNEYQRAWDRKCSDELKRLRETVKALAEFPEGVALNEACGERASK